MFWPRGAVKKIAEALGAPWTGKVWEPRPTSFTSVNSKGKDKGKGHPRKGHEGPEEV